MTRLTLISTLTLGLAGLPACTGDGPGTTGETGGESSGPDTSASETNTTSETTTAETSGGTGPSACSPDLVSLRDTIFGPSCALAGCHVTSSPAAGLDFEAANLEAQLVGAPAGSCDGWVRVVPGSPDESLLYQKMADAAPCGAVMPPTGALGADALACVSDWISAIEGMDCETCGGDACVDLESDNDHCGACGNSCPAGVPCVSGACSCGEGEDLCNDACVDVMADPLNCGSCGFACPGGQVCWMGVCADTCAALTDCDGGCVDLQTDPDNCGACNNACGDGNACEAGGCGCPGDGAWTMA